MSIFMREFLHVKHVSVNCGNKLISDSLLFIWNEKLVNERDEVGIRRNALTIQLYSF